MEKAPQNPRWNFPAKQQQPGFALSEGWTPFCYSTHYAFSDHKWFSNKHYPEASDTTPPPETRCKSLQGGPGWWWIFSAPSPRRCSAHTCSQKELYHRCLGGWYQLKRSGDFLSCGLTCDVFYSFATQSMSSDISWELTGNEHSEVPTQTYWIRKHIFKKSSWICECILNFRSLDPDPAKIYYTAIILLR